MGESLPALFFLKTSGMRGEESLVFSSPVFLLIFLPLVLCVYYNPFFKGRSFRNYTLLFFSLGFFAWGEPIFVFVMLFSIVINWFFALQIDRQESLAKRRWLLFFPIAFDVGLIFVFKYLGFAARTLGPLLGRGHIQLDIALPIGISFFTFQIMSYVFDVYRRTAPAQKNVLNVGLYISLFPQLIAGPIVRYETVAHEIGHRRETAQDFTAGVTRFVFGLGKKVLLANYVGLIADNIFGLTTGLSVATAWLGAIAYALQIYFDFSGYSDMAIGLGRMFGFHFLENFNYPYIANSVTDFWRRWHISLSSWFRDYVYIPMGGNRKGKARWVLNLLTVWLLTGLWHGASWNFVVWGLYYFAFLLFERLTNITRRLGPLSHVYTLLVVLGGWVLFRVDGLNNAIHYLGYLVGRGATSLVDRNFFYYLNNGRWVLIASLLGCLPLARWVGQRWASEAAGKPLAKARYLGRSLAMVLVFALALMVCINATYNPFIYFNF